MKLLLPRATIEALKEDQRARLRNAADHTVGQMLDAILAEQHRIVDVTTEHGARRMTAAVFLLRAVGILSETRAASERPVLQVIGLRSTFELAVVGRYFVAHRDGEDEFRRRYNKSIVDDAKLALSDGSAPAPPADFLRELITPDSKRPRALTALVRDLDDLDGHSANDEYSLQACYRLLYGFVSSTAMHASVSSVKRFTRRDGDVLMVDPAPEPVFNEPPVLLIAALVADLAHDVFSAMGLPTTNIPGEIARPRNETT